MQLQLTAEISSTANGSRQVVVQHFGTEGGTIGRAPHCHMVLADAQRRISRIQGQIICEGNDFYLINASTSNPVYVNGQELQPGERSRISDGDEWLTGNFLIRASMSMSARSDADTASPSGDFASPLHSLFPKTDPQENPFAWVNPPSTHQSKGTHPGLGADPFADLMGSPINEQIAAVPIASNQARQATQIPADFNPLTTASMSQRNSNDPLLELRSHQGTDDIFQEKSLDILFNPAEASIDTMTRDPLQAAEHQALVDSAASTDPLRIFDQAFQSHALNPEKIALESLSTSFNAADHRLEIGSYFKAPRALPPASHDGEKQTPPEATAHSQAENIISSEINVASNAFSPETNTHGVEASPIADPIAVTPSGFTSHKETIPQGSTQEDCSSLLEAFKSGAGLSDSHYPTQLTPENMFLIGKMLSASVQGCMDLLASRAMAKQEVRVAVTLINAEANNPLKFLPSGASALAQMFGPRMPGFMSGPDALKNAHDDLRTHEMGMMAGSQAALQRLFDRFDPASLEHELEEQGRARALFATQRHARLWEMYRSRYKWLRDEMKDQTPAVWGSDFNNAYQAEVTGTRKKASRP